MSVFILGFVKRCLYQYFHRIHRNVTVIVSFLVFHVLIIVKINVIMFRRYLWRSFLMLFFCGTFFAVQGQEKDKPIVVLELFTSQGCSSCPIADELLDELKNIYAKQDVFVLSYHVDYWNRLGWKDPFSQKDFSDYQRSYASVFRSQNIYTPQLVVNGMTEFVGGHKQRALQTISTQQQQKAANTIALKIRTSSTDKIVLDYKTEGATIKDITLVLVVSERVTKIVRGENRNRTLKNANIVAFRIVRKESEGRAVLELPSWIRATDELSIVGFSQNEKWQITGASRIKI